MDSVSSAVAISEQACNECRRRKGRCDRILPQCSPCARFNRHCLYHKHSRTPLTRRHLTTVEEQLRQSEYQLQCMQRRAVAAEARLQNGGTPSTGAPPPAAAAATAFTPLLGPFEPESPSTGRDATAALATQRNVSHWMSGDAARPVSANTTSSEVAIVAANNVAARSNSQRDATDSHISDAEDLSWDEQTPNQPSTGSLASGPHEERAGVADGMASLSVEAKGTGYLGAASGAAMLRLLLPVDRHRGSLKSLRQSSAGGHHQQLSPESTSHGWVPTAVYHERGIAQIDLDGAIDAYFSLYHISYPIVHQPTFRAQYMQVITRPGSWNALAYIIGALGMFTTGSDDRDLDLFEAAKANISLETLETGNVTLVQTLTLMSNYLQKRNKPNSGYNYLGLALHMAMGIGLHKDFASAKIRPLAMETRRRVWWTLQVFAVGAMITFGRPLSWPSHGVEASIPLNIDERDLTHASTSLPSARTGITAYSSVIWQTRFHLSTNEIYTKVINASFSSVDELLDLDDRNIEPWRQQWSQQAQDPPARFKLSRSIMEWRYRNFRIIMYRPFVIRHALQSHTIENGEYSTGALQTAIERCMHEARESINSIRDYWTSSMKNRMSAWYALYFLFQASLIPCVRLRNEPSSEHAPEWRTQIRTSLDVINDIGHLNPASKECKEVVSRLCSQYLFQTSQHETSPGANGGMLLEPIEESPLTQIDNMYPMMWPGTDILDFGMEGQYSQDNFDFNFGFETDP